MQRELSELWEAYSQNKDLVLRNEIVDKYMYLAKSIAGHYFAKRIGGQADYDDYLHYAVIGLIQSVERFSARTSIKFSTYASYRIKGSILNAIKGLSEKSSQLSSREGGRGEVIESFVEPGGNERDRLSEVIDITLNYAYSYFLQESVYCHDQDGSNAFEGYRSYELEQLKSNLGRTIKMLPVKERQVIESYYYYELSFTEIADLLQLSKGRVSQLHKNGIVKIRKLYEKLFDIDKSI